MALVSVWVGALSVPSGSGLPCVRGRRGGATGTELSGAAGRGGRGGRSGRRDCFLLDEVSAY